VSSRLLQHPDRNLRWFLKIYAGRPAVWKIVQIELLETHKSLNAPFLSRMLRRLNQSQYPTASLSLEAVSGKSRKRVPVASATAFAMAAEVGPWPASPAPRNGRPGRFMR
jgi:hypothetical protein